ncbi:RidA family protein [Photobacterium gaetbulicola]|uniref:Translation initiation inhibitor n=1 Tax=Photobacterium gaetbulicola Gung47 TaxID=658445 RepID=A0A0C5WJS3_9GAMM|nr:MULTISPECIES: RidA family protein [Photobacterium]AJR05349.1 translation initiation inhibitor [Photobacterium gaetbulicola Gung47]PSU12675.1 RidA family protein [Photobacterium gaetbulicola]WEM44468.1 RidA family protein [Photobacterium sp. DA100]
MTQTINTVNAPAAVGPYVQGKHFGNMLITSGQLPLNPETNTMPEDVAAQAKQSLANVEAIVNEAGMTKADIVKATVFVKDLNDFATVNEVYAAFFGENCPARSCVEVARLPLDAKVEIEVIAVKG